MNTLIPAVSTSPVPSWVRAADLDGPSPLGGTWCDEAQCLRGVAWGIDSWFDPDAGCVVWQDLDFFPVDRHQYASPLILYVHAPRESKTIEAASGPLFECLVQVARASGFSVASLEYRNPVTDDQPEPPPDNDIAMARRWLNAHALQLGIDTRNVFLVDQSRGSLGLWTALQHRRDPALQINAAYSHQLRTTCHGTEVARRFVVESDWLAFVDRIPPEHAYDGVVPYFQRHLR